MRSHPSTFLLLGSVHHENHCHLVGEVQAFSVLVVHEEKPKVIDLVIDRIWLECGLDSVIAEESIAKDGQFLTFYFN